MGARVGDRVVVEGNQVGVGRRSGTILEVLGDPDAPHYRVKWDGGHESVFFPGSDAAIEPADAGRGV